MASLVAAWAAVLLLADISKAAPGISFPINSQVPPVARVGQPFSFVFSPSTFSSSSVINYALVNSPPWLSVDSAARRLFGTPGDADIAPGQVVGVHVSLVATDASGSATLDTTLVVSRSPGPRVNLPLERQVPKFGVFSAPSSILSAPETEFSFTLAPDTFVDPSKSPLNYYAVMADNSPLPAWISFNSGGLTFSGRTPPSESLIQPPQRFGFQVVASDVVGFAAASLQFDIVVGSDIPKGGDKVGDAPAEKHQLTAEKTKISVDATAGSAISHPGLRDTIKLDGKLATAENVIITSVANTPPWLTVDKNTWEIHGVPPESAEPTSFVVTVQEMLSNTTLDLTIQIDIQGKKSAPSNIFKGDIAPLTATSGESFSYDLGPHLTNPNDIDISLSSNPSAPWIQYDSRTAIISGSVPPDLPSSSSSFTLSISAKSKSSPSLTDTLSLKMHILPFPLPKPDLTPPSTTQPSTTPILDATPHSTDSSLASASDNYGTSQPNLMLLAILLPLFILLLSVTCLLFWYYRRRNESASRPRLTTRDISGPLPGTFVRNDSYGPPISCQDLDEAAQLSSAKRSRDNFNTTSRDAFVNEQKEYLESRNTYLSNASIPRPQATVRLLPPIERSPVDMTMMMADADDVFGTGTVPLLTPIKPLRLTRQHELRNDRSLSSISETSFYEGGANSDSNVNVTTIPLGGGGTTAGKGGLLGAAGTPFRGGTAEVHIPTFRETNGSITQTPESAYTAPRSEPVSVAGSYVELRGSQEGLRTQSRLGHYPQMQVDGGRKFAWPWLKKAVGVNMMGKAAKGVKTHARKLSVATVDTFAYRRAGEGEKEKQLEKEMSPSPPPPRLAKPVVTESSARPTTRRGPVAGQGSAWGGADAAIASSPTMGYSALPGVDISPVAMAVAGDGWRREKLRPADSLGILEMPARGDSNSNSDNNYEELVSGGPFQASKTWSSVGGMSGATRRL
ncbi:hypothetical protein B0T16DRAFT_394590 [Cercophora newfieldiana]|uniref:Dystroglycan-type cadherin-like domain-containing protein n=1 Tax=Cercophora newfieldiana TaxID=92897 RepID=A0AA39XRF2_9PEZI|nr:hypothetical protein B0T16DRAFT_394590 [Cercophora newfieldiana]